MPFYIITKTLNGELRHYFRHQHCRCGGGGSGGGDDGDGWGTLCVCGMQLGDLHTHTTNHRHSGDRWKGLLKASHIAHLIKAKL